MKNFLLLLLILFCQSFYAQIFTWIKGSNSIAVPGTYGAMGFTSPSNNPGARHGAATWTDAAGNLWLFGGEGLATNNSICLLNDLWKFDISNNQWTWIRGANTPNPLANYGTLGVAAPTNEPGSREFMSAWTDAAGNFWLFGGEGYASTSTLGSLGDLWKYDPISNQWTWVKGFNTIDQNGIYGSMNVSSPTNMPGSRYGPGSWKDNNGNLYLFGGRGFPAGGINGQINDLWKYSISSNEWTWIHGSNVVSQNGVYGTLGVSNPANTPGGRYLPTSTQDASGNFYLFGGVGFPAVNTAGYLNDLWKYNVTSNAWTWMGGTNLINQRGYYGTLGATSPTVHPGGRFSAAAWSDILGNVWLFGGRGLDTNNTSLTGDLNDLWKFEPAQARWTWMKGSNAMFANGNYGTLGVPAVSNMPGARRYNTAWRDYPGQFWLFGGDGRDATSTISNNMSDLWFYKSPCNPDSVTVVPGGEICSGSSVTLTAHNSYSTTVNWFNSATTTVSIGSGSVYTTAPLWVVSTSVYTLFAESNGCSSLPRTPVMVTVNPLPPIVVSGTSAVCPGSTVTLFASGASTYTWSTGSNTNSTSVAPTGSLYTAYVIGTSAAGCENSTSHTITVNGLPTLTVTKNKSSYCANHGEIATVSVTGASSYMWSNTMTAPTITLTSTIPALINLTVTGVDTNGCVNSKTVQVQYYICFGISDHQQSVRYNLYPNPNNGQFTLDTEDNITMMFELYNILGEKIYQKEIDGNQNIISTGASPGVYTFRIYTDRKSSTGKLVIE